jgi:hypothetical protein
MALDQSVDFPVKRALWAGAGLALTVAVVIGAVLLMLRYWDLPPGGPPAVPRTPLDIAGPALQTDPQLEHARYLAEQQHWLSTAAWVDAPAGIARIPLDDAMKLMAQGKASRSGSPASTNAAASSPGQASTGAPRGAEARQ